jgi:hypothetical protein
LLSKQNPNGKPATMQSFIFSLFFGKALWEKLGHIEENLSLRNLLLHF